MTRMQMQAALMHVASFGDAGAPTSALPVGRWLELKGRRAVIYRGDDRWRITAVGRLQIAGASAPRARLRRAG